MDVHPLVFEPIFQRRIWGGDRLSRLGKTLPADQPTGESWELADLENGQSVVRTGPAAGQTLHDLVEHWGEKLLGGVELFEGRFPLLIKFLDAVQDLSVQVHPDEAMARRLGPEVRVKNEAWYVIDADAQGAIYVGLKDGVDRAAFAAAIKQGTVSDTLRRVPVKQGDCYYLPSGTVHALGAGVLVAEVQNPSDVTYRVYDWDRLDPATQRPRDLHIDEALECINFDAPQPSPPRSHVASVWTTVTRLVECESFLIERVRMAEGFQQQIPHGGMVVWIVLEGQGRITTAGGRDEWLFTVGDVVLLPAGLNDAVLDVPSDSMWLEVTVPTRSNLDDFAERELGAAWPQTGGRITQIGVPDRPEQGGQR